MNTCLGVHCLLLATLLSVATSVYADIVNCNGQWTNKPCSDKILSKIKETPLDPRLKAPDFAEKQQVIGDIRAYATSLSSLGINYPLDSQTHYCLDEKHTLSDCRKNFLESRLYYDSLATDARKSQAIKEEQKRTQESSSSTAAESGSTVIIQQQVLQPAPTQPHPKPPHEIDPDKPHVLPGGSDGHPEKPLPQNNISEGGSFGTGMGDSGAH